LNSTMKWFIGCLMLIFLGLGVLTGMYLSITFHVVSDALDEHNRKNLLILYSIKED